MVTHQCISMKCQAEQAALTWCPTVRVIQAMFQRCSWP